MVKGRIEQAVIYDPTRNDLYCSTRGRGAYLNDRRIRVAKRTTLRECLLSTGFPFRPGDAFQTYLQLIGDVMPGCAGVRRTGSAALDLAYVAAGFSDGFFELGLSPWDVAAGSLIVTEAGGLIGNFSGESDFLEQKECLAANPRIYGQLIGILGKYSKFASAGDKAAVRQARSGKLGKADDAAGAEADGAPADAEHNNKGEDAPF
jgi:myo-inositol-1(or 4)-monophosphatase